MRSLLFLVLATGCGFRVSGGAPIDGEPGDTPVQGDGPADAPADAPVDAPQASGCLAKWLDGTVELSAPTQLLQLGSTTDDDRDPFISSDELMLYFASDRTGSSGGSDVYVATRISTAASFGVPVKANDLSSNAYDTRVTMTSNGLIAVRSADNQGTPDLALATRASTSASFGTFSTTAFGSLNDSAAQLDPELSSDGLHLYYAQGAQQRIVMVSRASLSDPFVNPTDIVASGAGDADPALSDDERILIFASNRAGNGNVYYATRTTPTGTFGTPVEVPTINTGGDAEGDPSLSTDGCTLYFASNRGSGGDWELYASRVMMP